MTHTSKKKRKTNVAVPSLFAIHEADIVDDDDDDYDEVEKQKNVAKVLTLFSLVEWWMWNTAYLIIQEGRKVQKRTSTTFSTDPILCSDESTVR